MAADRVARGRGRADQVLALDLAEKHHLPRSGRRRQIALAGRARLSGTQAGGRARTLRGTRLARLSPSRHPVHRGIWIPDLREGDDSPLKTSFRPAVPATCHTRQLSTPRILPCGLNGTSQTRSPPCAEGSSPLALARLRADDAIHPLAIELLRDEGEAELLSDGAGEEPSHRVLLPPGLL